MARKKFNRMNLIWIAIAVVAAVLIVPQLFSALQPTPEPTPVVVEEPTDYEFLVLDYITGEEMDDDDHSIQIYRVDISELEESEIEDLEYADYELDEDKDSGEKYSPDEDYLYWCKLNGSDVVEQWFVPVLGLNTIYAMNLTEDIAMAAFSKDELSTTVNQTTYDEWIILTQTLDDVEGTGEATSSEGFLPYYDFEDDEDKFFVIRIEFNTTAQLSWCDFESAYTFNERTSGVYMYYEIDAVIAGSTEFEIDFGSTIGTDFEVIGISVGYDTADSFTAWDTQN